MAAHDVLEPGRIERCADHVVRLGAGIEEHLPAGLAESGSSQSTSSLIRKKSSSNPPIESTASLPHEQARAEQVVRLTHRLVIEARAEERVQRLGVGRELAQEEVFGCEPPGSRVAANRALERAVGIEQPRADDGRLRMLVDEGDQVLERALGEPRVRVQEQEVPPGSGAHACVVAGAEATVLLLDDARLRETARGRARASRRSSRCRRRSPRRPSRGGSRADARSTAPRCT